ncbi:SDR family NAD(P)-dependent oxidoreductase, partial [Luminiphilus sp.]|nr:SDR family NAD(P)-dependent oxidoreductase [Luminiphilus sp.]
MSLQLLMIDTLRVFPKWLLRAFAGPAPVIDGNTLDMNMHVLATLSAKGNKGSAAQSLKATTGAMVINLCSVSSIHGIPLLAVYSATKFYVDGLTQALNIEWQDDDIFVTCVKPP